MSWIQVPEAQSQCIVLKNSAGTGSSTVLSCSVGDGVQAIAVHTTGYVVVRCKGKIGLLPASHIAPRHMRLLRGRSDRLVDGHGSGQSVTLRMNRAQSTLREQLKEAFTLQTPDRITFIQNELSQLADWRQLRLEMEAGSGSASRLEKLDDCILQLIDGTTPQTPGVIQPRTAADDVMTEHNASIMELLDAHHETEQRVKRRAGAPATASESLTRAIANNFHGGPFVSNERAQNLFLSGDRTHNLAGIHAAPQLESQPLTQLLMEFDVARAMQALRQPAEVYAAVFDAEQRCFLSHEAVVHVDATGMPVKAGARGGKVHHRGEGADMWCQALFTNLPSALIASGNAFIVFRAYRKGPLTESAASAAAISTVATSRDDTAVAASKADGIASPSLLGMFSRKRHDSATYLRPIGVGISWIPPAINTFTAGTPHKPDPVVFFRPTKGEEVKFPAFHNVLIDEHIRTCSFRRTGRTVSDAGAIESEEQVRKRRSEAELDDLIDVKKVAGSGGVAQGPQASPILHRSVRLEPLPIVCRAFGMGQANMFTHASFNHLFSPRNRGGCIVPPACFAYTHVTDSSGFPTDADSMVLSIPALRHVPPEDCHRIVGTHFSQFRNDLLVTLQRGTFSQDSKLAPRNIQVRIHVVNGSGHIFPCLFRGFAADNGPPTDPHLLHEYRSCVYYHTNQPVFEETILVRIPSDAQYADSHLLITFWHASSNEHKTNMFSFTFMALTNIHGIPVRDGHHSLRCYKPVAGMEKGVLDPSYLSVGGLVASDNPDPYAPTSDRSLPATAVPLHLRRINRSSTAPVVDWVAGSQSKHKGEPALGKDASSSSALEPRKDVFELSTTLLSDHRSSFIELHFLGSWRRRAPDVLITAMQELRHLTTMPLVFIQHFHLVMESLCEMISTKAERSEGVLLEPHVQVQAMDLLVLLLHHYFAEYSGCTLYPSEVFLRLLHNKNHPPILLDDHPLQQHVKGTKLLTVFLERSVLPPCHVPILRYLSGKAAAALEKFQDSSTVGGATITDFHDGLLSIDVLLQVCLRSLACAVASTPENSPILVDEFKAIFAQLVTTMSTLSEQTLSVQTDAYFIACAWIRQLARLIPVCPKFMLPSELYRVIESCFEIVVNAAMTQTAAGLKLFRLLLAVLLLSRAVLRREVLTLLAPELSTRVLSSCIAVLTLSTNFSPALRLLSLTVLKTVLSLTDPATLHGFSCNSWMPLVAELLRCVCSLAQWTVDESDERTTCAVLLATIRRITAQSAFDSACVESVVPKLHLFFIDSVDSVGDCPCDVLPSDFHSDVQDELHLHQVSTPAETGLAALKVAGAALFTMLQRIGEEGLVAAVAAGMPYHHYLLHISLDPQQLKGCQLLFCQETLRACLWLLQIQPYNESWITMNRMQITNIEWTWNAICKSLSAACSPYADSPLNDQVLNTWQLVMEVGVALLTTPLDEHLLMPPEEQEALRTSVIAALRAIWGIPNIIQSSQLEYSQSGRGRNSGAPAMQPLPSLMKVALADTIVASLLDLTHSSHGGVAIWARDTYFDIIRSELSLSSVSDSRPAKLSLVERLTIDAIDVLVKSKGPILASATDRSEGKISDAQAPDADLFTSASGYVPPADNLIMSLFAPETSSPVTQPCADRDESESARPGVHSLSRQRNHRRLDNTTHRLEDAEDIQKLLKHPVVIPFLAEIRTLYTMLSSVSRYPPTADYENERTEGALTLIQYLRRTHRHDIYVKYVSFLHDMHAALGNTAESGLAYLLYADIVSWDEDMLPAVYTEEKCLFPTERSWMRKESVLLRAIKVLIEAQCWESALSVCNQLASRYASQTFEYTKLGRLMTTQSQLVYNIAHLKRIFPSYFLVHFVNGTFPESCRGKLFIYKGSLGERLGGFEARMDSKWPGCKRLPLHIRPMDFEATEVGLRNRSYDAATPVSEIAFAGAAILGHIPVHPLYDTRPAKTSEAGGGADLLDRTNGTPCNGSVLEPALVREGRVHASARYFVFSRPFRQRAVKTDQEFLDTWISRVYLATKEIFPGTRRRSEVVYMIEVILNPIEIAILQLDEKNRALFDHIERAATGTDRTAEQEFSQILSGVVDAAVSGGINNFKPFFTGEYRESHPEIYEDMSSDPRKHDLVDKLKNTLLEQCTLLARGIRVHAVKCTESMLPLHDFLTKRYDTMLRTFAQFGIKVSS